MMELILLLQPPPPPPPPPPGPPCSLSECSRLQSSPPPPPPPGGKETTMFLVSFLVLLVLLVSAEGSVGPSSNSSFCTESKECLEYQLVCKTDEYEVRHYSPTRWVSTDAEAYFMGVGAAMAFRRLFQYISGANEGGVQMEMTAPVLVKIPEETRMWEPAIYSLNFPLPAAYQEKPPAPTNDKLYFSDMPEMDVYVRSYGGWMLSVTSRLHAHLLTKELGRVGASYNHSFHYGVGYDSPLKLLNRHNEVWYLAEGELVCSDPQEPTPAHRPSLTQTQFDSPAPSPTPSNQSSTANSSEPPAPQYTSPSPSSDPPTSAQQDQIQQDQATNSSEPLSPSLEPQSDGALWNGTTHDSAHDPAHSSLGQSANKKLEAEPTDAQ